MLSPKLKTTIVTTDRCWEASGHEVQQIVKNLLKFSKVYFLEHTQLFASNTPTLSEIHVTDGPIILRPYLPRDTKNENKEIIIQELILQYINQENILDYETWIISPMTQDVLNRARSNRLITFINDDEYILDKYLSDSDVLVNLGSNKVNGALNVEEYIDYDFYMQARLRLIAPDELKQIPSPIIALYNLKDPHFIKLITQAYPELHFINFTSRESISLPNVTSIQLAKNTSIPLYLSQCKFAITSNCSKSVNEILAAGKELIAIGLDSTPMFKGVHNLDELKKLIPQMVKTNSPCKEWLQIVDKYLEKKSWNALVDRVLNESETAIIPLRYEENQFN